MIDGRNADSQLHRYEDDGRLPHRQTYGESHTLGEAGKAKFDL
jgi:hypothetical protein